MRRPRTRILLLATAAAVLASAPLGWAAFFARAGSDGNSLAAAASFDGYAAVVAADAPAGYWRLGETSGSAADASGNGNAGTYTNGPVLGQAGGLLDDSDSAVRFDGTDDEVRVPHAASLNLGDTFTLEAWIKRASTTTTDSILEKGSAYELALDADGRLVLRRGSGGDIAESTRKVTDTRWHHVAATKNGSTVRLYLDGANVTGRVSSVTLSDNSDTLTIGSAPAFDGTLDEVAIYPTALSADRIVAHAYAGRPYHGEVKSDSPGGYWRLGEASGTSELAFDSQNANHAAHFNAPTRGTADALISDADPAVQLDGVDDHLKAPDATSLDLGNTFTLEAWIKRDAVSTSSVQTIFHKESGAYIFRILSDNRLSLRKSLAADVVASTATITDTTNWHHVAVTKTGATTRLYLDGADVTGTVTDQTFADNALPLWIGKDGPGSARFAGSLDEAAVYPTALSAARIQAHFEAGRPYREEVRTDAPVSWWRMADSGTPLEYLGLRGAFYNGGSGTVLPINRPVEVAPGDLMVAAIHESGGTSCSLTAPSGWALVRSQTLETATRTSVFSRIAGASEPTSYTWTSSCNADHAGAILAYANADPSTPIDTSNSQENAASLSVTCPAVTTTRAGAALLAFPFTHDGTSFTFPSPMIERFDLRTGTSSFARTMAGATETLGAAGSTGTRTPTNANPYGHTTPTSACVTVAIRPMFATLHDQQHTNPGTWSGSPTFQSAGAIVGDDDPAATLDGTSAQVTVPSSASLNLGDGPFTLEAWVKLATSTSNGTILDKGTGAYRLAISGSRLTLERPGTGTIAQSTNTIADTAWHHVVATKNGSSVRLYVDGTDVTGTVTNSTMANNSTSLRIGGATFFPGSLDEIAIYNKVLSVGDVMRHHRAGRG